MASNPVVDIFKVKDLRSKLLFTLGILVVYRLGTFITIPGIDVNVLKNYFASQTSSGSGMGFTEYLDFFAGGAFSRFSIFMLGITPYISTSIIMNLLLMVFPALKRRTEEDGGKKKIKRYTRYGTLVICLIQSATTVAFAYQIPDAVIPSMAGIKYTVIAMLTVTTGTMFLVWMGEQINARGIGNGISLLIFAGIVARMPGAIKTLVNEVRSDNLNPVFAIVAVLLFVVIIVLIVYEQQGQRKIPVNYAKRVVGRRMFGGQNTYIPFKINPSGVIPVIFAGALLMFPLQLVKALGISNEFWRRLGDFMKVDGGPYMVAYALLIVFFAYFYTQVSMNPTEIAKSIRENGGSIPGIRSEHIDQYLLKILNRIILPGSLFLAMIALVPSIVINLFGFPRLVAQLMGGTSLIIMVGVDLDLMSQIEGHLKMHHHDGLVKSGKLQSRNL